MSLLDRTREKALIELAQTRFNPVLRRAEMRVLHDSASSENLTPPERADKWPVVRPAFLRWLATDPEAAKQIDPKGLRVYGATIPRNLDLEECHVNPTLDFRCCEFRGKINLQSAETRGIYIFVSSLSNGISADGAIVHGPLFLRGIVSADEIRLNSAEITGQLSCNGASLKAMEDALSADNAKIGGGVFLIDGFESEGEIRLLGAEITGQLACNGAKLKAKGDALSADRAKIGGIVFLDGIESEGAIRLLGAEITGQLACNGAKLKAKGNALHAEGAKIGGDVFLKGGFESEGEIRLLGAEIAGQLACNGAKLKTKGDALSADGAKIGGGVFLVDGFESDGEIRLLGAEITGQLSCNGAKLKAKGDALSADRAKIGGSVFLRDGFESEGTIRLPGAEIGGNLSFIDAKVVVVVCQNTVIKGDLIWQRIGKSEKTGVNLVGAKVKNLRDDKDSWPEEGMLDLDGLAYEELTLHESLSDEESKAGRYARELPLNARERIAWLMLQPPDRRIEPQPWMQLRDLLERKGDQKGAKHVVFKYRCLAETRSLAQKIVLLLMRILNAIESLFKDRNLLLKRVFLALRSFWAIPAWPFIYCWNCFYAWMEENPFRIVWSIALTLFVGTSIFNWGNSQKAMIQTVQLQPNMVLSDEDVTRAKALNPDFTKKPGEENKPVSVHYPLFQPFIYTLENAVPPVKLGMDDKWMPDPSPAFRQSAFPGNRWLGFMSLYGILTVTRWALIVWGWIQATVLVAALAERFKK